MASVLASLAYSPAQAEFLLTAEIMPTVGLDGFDTYRITATSDLGNIVGFDFSEVGSYGLTGPMNQVNPLESSTIFNDVSLGKFNIDSSQDTRFLFNSLDVVSLFATESNTALHGAFALSGDKQLTIGNSVPFLQIATPQSSQVNLKGTFVVRRPNDELIEFAIDTPLSAIRVGAAPQMSILPIPEPVLPVAPPVIPTPGPITPPAPPIGGIGDAPPQLPQDPILISPPDLSVPISDIPLVFVEQPGRFMPITHPDDQDGGASNQRENIDAVGEVPVGEIRNGYWTRNDLSIDLITLNEEPFDLSKQFAISYAFDGLASFTSQTLYFYGASIRAQSVVELGGTNAALFASNTSSDLSGVPEPSSMFMLAFALTCLGSRRSRTA